MPKQTHEGLESLLEDVWMAAHPEGAIIVGTTVTIVRDGDREWRAATLVEALRAVLADEDARAKPALSEMGHVYLMLNANGSRTAVPVVSATASASRGPNAD